jgi:hypothetical protein
LPGGGKGGCGELLGWLVAPAAGGAGDSGCRRGLGRIRAGGFRLAIFVAWLVVRGRECGYGWGVWRVCWVWRVTVNSEWVLWSWGFWVGVSCHSVSEVTQQAVGFGCGLKLC